MTTKTDFYSVKELREKYAPKERGFVNDEEITIIREVLEVDQRNDIELQNIRDMAVMLYGGWADSMRKKDCKDGDAEAGRKYMELLDAMSAITHVIDVEKVKRGLAV